MSQEVFLLRYASRDTRCIDFPQVDGKSTDTPVLGRHKFFVQEFRAKYVTKMYRDSKWKQFLNLKQRSLSVAEYEKEFSHLSKYAPELILTEAFQCRQFEDRLHDSIKRYLAPMTSLQAVDFY